MKVLSKEIERGLLKIEKLDLKEKPYWDIVNALSKIQPVGQPYPPYIKALDKINDICEAKAIIWNQIRNYTIPPTTKTLWQIAISQKLPVVFWGEEKHLKFSSKEIKATIKYYKMVKGRKRKSKDFTIDASRQISEYLDEEQRREKEMRCLNCNRKIGWVERETHEEYIEYINLKDIKNGGFCSFKCESNYKKED